MKWRSGPPPSIGWWPASTGLFEDVYRWWDGKQWSWPALSWWPAEKAAEAAAKPAASDWSIKWTDRPASWPERNRT